MDSMPAIRFINLDRDLERRARLEAELRRLGLQGERFAGVLWATLPEGDQRRLYSELLNAKQFHKPLVNGEKGCYASHLALWQWLQASSHPLVIVLEDDVRLIDAFTSACQAIAALPADWDMIKLIGRSGLGKREKLASQVALCAGHDLVRYRRVPSLTAGYALSRRGAEKLLDTRIPFGRPIDVDLRHWWESRDLDVRGVEPPVIVLDEETSQDSSIGVKVAEDGLRSKWRKFRHKLQYSLHNAWHGP